jgi:cell shape-determining protein MreC
LNGAKEQLECPQHTRTYYTALSLCRSLSLSLSLCVALSHSPSLCASQAATGITDINELVTSFINAEGQNFSLFNFANELNQDTEKLEEQLADLKTQLESAKGTDSSDEGLRKSTMVTSLLPTLSPVQSPPACQRHVLRECTASRFYQHRRASYTLQRGVR